CDDGSIMLREPLHEHMVRHADRDRYLILGDTRRRLEPGVEAVPVHLRLDARQDLIPDGHFSKEKGPALRFRPQLHRGNRAPIVAGLAARGDLVRFSDFRPRLTGCKYGEKSASSAISGEFPQFFPQVWKTLGRDQTYMSSAGVPGPLKEE